MKSSTRNLTNPHSLVADKRFEALVKKEMVEHQNIISSHHKEMQSLKDSLNLAIDKFESLSQYCLQELKEFKEQTDNHMRFVKEKIIASDLIMTEQRKTIESLHQQLNEFHENYASKNGVDKFKKDLDSSIKENTISHIQAFQELQRELKTLIKSLQNDLLKLKLDSDRMHGELDKKIDSSFSLSCIDKEGVLKNIRVYDKSIFIIEKKIENIYTLIERINKRGEVCHKPES